MLLLKRGDTLPSVAAAQALLNAYRNGEPLVVDGVFGPQTQLAMLTNGTLTEPEGAAALAVAAHASGHSDVSQAALKRCKLVAKERAQQVCRRQ
jgi:hypothetical protein